MFFISGCPGDFHGRCKTLIQISFLKQNIKSRQPITALVISLRQYSGMWFSVSFEEIIWRVNTWLNQIHSCFAWFFNFLLFKNGFMLRSWLWSLTTTELVSNGNLQEWKSWDSGFFGLSLYKHKRTEQLILSLYFPVSISNSLISEWEEHLWHTKRQLVVWDFCTPVMHQHGII